MGDFPLMPEQASSFAGRVDALYLALTLLTLLFAVTIPFVILYFMVKYHHSRKVFRQNPEHTDMRLEIAWIGGLSVLAIGAFVWSTLLYFDIYRAVPVDGLDIYVTGRQWMWNAQHPQGKRENNELHVPVNTPVRLIMTSQDVIHSFYIPAFRTKMDVLPGRFTTMWFEATKVGEYHLFCAEYCGTEHSFMRGRVVVLEPADYQRWLREGVDVIPQDAADAGGLPEALPPESAGEGLNALAAEGRQLFTSLGCAGCHASGPGAGGVGPSLVGIFGNEERLEGGETMLVDENYLLRSIVDPQAQIVEGYPPVMPSYENQLSDEQIIALIEYIKSLESEESAP